MPELRNDSGGAGVDRGVVAHPLEDALAHVKRPQRGGAGGKLRRMRKRGGVRASGGSGRLFVLRSDDRRAAKAADPMIAPDAVLPVKVTKDAAQKEVSNGSRLAGSHPTRCRKWRTGRDRGRLSSVLDLCGGYRQPIQRLARVHYWVTESYTTTDSNGNQVQQTGR